MFSMFAILLPPASANKHLHIHKMSMPETAIYEDARTILSQNQVRMSWQQLVVLPISESLFPRAMLHNHLRFIVLRPDSSMFLWCCCAVSLSILLNKTYKSNTNPLSISFRRLILKPYSNFGVNSVTPIETSSIIL